MGFVFDGTATSTPAAPASEPPEFTPTPTSDPASTSDSNPAANSGQPQFGNAEDSHLFPSGTPATGSGGFTGPVFYNPFAQSNNATQGNQGAGTVPEADPNANAADPLVLQQANQHLFNARNIGAIRGGSFAFLRQSGALSGGEFLPSVAARLNSLSPVVSSVTPIIQGFGKGFGFAGWQVAGLAEKYEAISGRLIMANEYDRVGDTTRAFSQRAYAVESGNYGVYQLVFTPHTINGMATGVANTARLFPGATSVVNTATNLANWARPLQMYAAPAGMIFNTTGQVAGLVGDFSGIAAEWQGATTDEERVRLGWLGVDSVVSRGVDWFTEVGPVMGNVLAFGGTAAATVGGAAWASWALAGEATRYAKMAAGDTSFSFYNSGVREGLAISTLVHEGIGLIETINPFFETNISGYNNIPATASGRVGYYDTRAGNILGSAADLGVSYLAYTGAQTVLAGSMATAATALAGAAASSTVFAPVAGVLVAFGGAPIVVGAIGLGVVHIAKMGLDAATDAVNFSGNEWNNTFAVAAEWNGFTGEDVKGHMYSESGDTFQLAGATICWGAQRADLELKIQYGIATDEEIQLLADMEFGDTIKKDLGDDAAAEVVEFGRDAISGVFEFGGALVGVGSGSLHVGFTQANAHSDWTGDVGNAVEGVGRSLATFAVEIVPSAFEEGARILGNIFGQDGYAVVSEPVVAGPVNPYGNLGVAVNGPPQLGAFATIPAGHINNYALPQSLGGQNWGGWN